MSDGLASYEFCLRALPAGGTLAEMRERVIREYLAENPEAQRTDLNITSITETVTVSERIELRPATPQEAARLRIAEGINQAADTYRLVPRYSAEENGHG